MGNKSQRERIYESNMDAASPVVNLHTPGDNLPSPSANFSGDNLPSQGDNLPSPGDNLPYPPTNIPYPLLIYILQKVILFKNIQNMNQINQKSAQPYQT